MSTRREKTRQRKLARLEDRDVFLCLLQRLDQMQGPPEEWDTLNLNELREKYAGEKTKEAGDKT